MNMNIKAPLVLSVVCVAVSGLLAFANQLTAPRIAQAQEEKLSKSLVEVFGDCFRDIITNVISLDNENGFVHNFVIPCSILLRAALSFDYIWIIPRIV